MAEFRRFIWTNFADSTLVSSLSASATSLAVQEDHGQKFPDPDPTYDEEVFSLVLWKADLSAYEVVYGVGVEGDTITIERAKEGTTALAFEAGDLVVHTMTAAFPEQWSIAAMATLPVLTGSKAGTYEEDASLSWTAAVPADAENSVDYYEVWRQIGAGAATLIGTTDGSDLDYIDENVFTDNPTSSITYYVVAVPLSGPTGQSIDYVFPGLIPRIVAMSSGSPFDTDKRFMYSDDGGETWTAAAEPVSATAPTDMCYSEADQLFVVIGGNGQCWTSPDGVTWTDRSSLTPDATTDWQTCAYSPDLGIYVALATSGSQRAMWTTNPASVAWTLVDAADNAESWQRVIWSSAFSRFCAGVATDPERTAISTDGKTWTSGTTLVSGGVTELAENPVDGMVVGTNRGDIPITYTNDGSTWSTATPSFGGGVLSIAYSPDLGVWIASGPTRGDTSSDGVTYSALSATWKNFESLIWSSAFSRFVGLPAGASGIAGYSTDGVNLTDVTGDLPTGAAAVSWAAMVEGYYEAV